MTTSSFCYDKFHPPVQSEVIIVEAGSLFFIWQFVAINYGIVIIALFSNNIRCIHTFIPQIGYNFFGHIQQQAYGVFFIPFFK